MKTKEPTAADRQAADQIENEWDLNNGAREPQQDRIAEIIAEAMEPERLTASNHGWRKMSDLSGVSADDKWVEVLYMTEKNKVVKPNVSIVRAWAVKELDAETMLFATHWRNWEGPTL